MPFAKVNGVNLHYEICSQKELSPNAGYLIILHGGPGVSDYNLYFDFWSQFSDQINVVFFDMRGHGLSEHGDSKDWTLLQWGKDVSMLCEVLNIKNPTIAGISFGGWVAISYALQQINQPTKLILCNTEACIDNNAQIEIYTKKGGEKAGETIRNIYVSPNKQHWVSYVKYCAPHMSKNPYQPHELARVKPNMELYQYFYQTGQHKFNYLPRLGELSNDVLILGGSDDPEHPLASTLAMSNALKNAKVQLEILKNAGDPVYRDFPGEVVKIIRSFIASKAENKLTLH